jgi:acetyltransferase-like isoleucine patch superfamily enzyme
MADRDGARPDPDRRRQLPQPRRPANGCFITDGNHRYDDPSRPVPWQGFTTKGPTRIGANVWCGANVVITSGVTVGERCVIGANSVVTRDLPAFSIAAGAPAKLLQTITY